jgi:hypothetical protein
LTWFAARKAYALYPDDGKFVLAKNIPRVKCAEGMKEIGRDSITKIPPAQHLDTLLKDFYYYSD